MPPEPASSLRPTRSGPSRSWPYSRVLWAGISIVTMWLAVLFVGVFGGDIINSTPGGTSSSVPVVVVLVPFALLATFAVARRGFRPFADEGQTTPDEPEQLPEERSAKTPDLRTKAA